MLISPGFPNLMGLDHELQRVATLAREAATAVYYVDSVGLEAAVPEPGRPLPSLFAEAWRRSGGSQDLAEATGGFTYRFCNSILPGSSAWPRRCRPTTSSATRPRGPKTAASARSR